MQTQSQNEPSFVFWFSHVAIDVIYVSEDWMFAFCFYLDMLQPYEGGYTAPPSSARISNFPINIG